MEDFDEGDFRPRTALPGELRDELRRRALDGADCIRLTLARHQGLGPAKESLRPVRLGDAVVWQLERLQGRQVVCRNFPAGEQAASAQPLLGHNRADA
ncbi:MAG: hypothetical protein IKH04_00855 [Kiritimatiellae bacterium]|nr:hypothetical protein [Kiritimatiellia bacterium]